jgi:hypothetical protein
MYLLRVLAAPNFSLAQKLTLRAAFPSGQRLPRQEGAGLGRRTPLLQVLTQPVSVSGFRPMRAIKLPV